MLIELSVPVGAFGLVEEPPLPEETSLELERTAAAVRRSFSILVSGDDVEAGVAALRESRAVEDVTLVAENDDGAVYRQTWVGALPEILEAAHGSAGALLSAVTVGDTWVLELRFPDHGAASQFHARYDAEEFPMTIRRVSPAETVRRASETGLTPKQSETLHRALEAGYFDIPRGVTTTELAAEMGISDTALLQRLQRGLTTVLRDSDSLSPGAPAVRNRGG